MFMLYWLLMVFEGNLEKNVLYEEYFFRRNDVFLCFGNFILLDYFLFCEIFDRGILSIVYVL